MVSDKNNLGRPDNKRRDVIAIPRQADEARILRQLVADLRTLVAAPCPSDDPLERLQAESQVPSLDQSNPAVARLFPSAYDDPALDREYRRLSEGTLRAARDADSQVVADHLELAEREQSPYFMIPRRETGAWLRTINAVRLVVAANLGVVKPEDESKFDELEALDEQDPRHGTMLVYDWMGYLQESILELTEF